VPLAHDLDQAIIQKDLTEAFTQTVDDPWCAGRSEEWVPSESDLRVHLVDVLTPSAAASGEGKSELGKRYYNPVHKSYDVTMMATIWVVYIIKNERGHYYTGITTDLERRFREHTGSKLGAKFFRSGAPVEVVWQREFPNRSEATKFECYVKGLTRTEKERLIHDRSKAC
jgi:putative endonuclease